MLKRIKSLVLVLVVAGGASGVTSLQGKHVCEMEGMDMMSCCESAQTHYDAPKILEPQLCCAASPQQPLPVGATYTLRVPSFSVALPHPALEHCSLTQLTPLKCPYSKQTYSQNLQASYIRNLSLLI